jgi:hypothetical protein
MKAGLTAVPAGGGRCASASRPGEVMPGDCPTAGRDPCRMPCATGRWNRQRRRKRAGQPEGQAAAVDRSPSGARRAAAGRRGGGYNQGLSLRPRWCRTSRRSPAWPRSRVTAPAGSAPPAHRPSLAPCWPPASGPTAPSRSSTASVQPRATGRSCPSPPESPPAKQTGSDHERAAARQPHRLHRPPAVRRTAPRTRHPRRMGIPGAAISHPGPHAALAGGSSA